MLNNNGHLTTGTELFQSGLSTKRFAFPDAVNSSPICFLIPEKLRPDFVSKMSHKFRTEVIHVVNPRRYFPELVGTGLVPVNVIPTGNNIKAEIENFGSELLEDFEYGLFAQGTNKLSFGITSPVVADQTEKIKERATVAMTRNPELNIFVMRNRKVVEVQYPESGEQQAIERILYWVLNGETTVD